MGDKFYFRISKDGQSLEEVGDVEINMNQNVTSNMEIELAGLKSFEQFRKLRDFLLNEIEGVSSVIQRAIKANSITVEVEYAGTQDRFIESILNNENFPYFAEISKNDEGNIIIQIK